MEIRIAVLLVSASAYFYPQLNEDTGSACGAIEKRFVKDAFSGSGGGDIFSALLASSASDGALAASMVKSAHLNLPGKFRPSAWCV